MAKHNKSKGSGKQGKGTEPVSLTSTPPSFGIGFTAGAVVAEPIRGERLPSVDLVAASPVTASPVASAGPVASVAPILPAAAQPAPAASNGPTISPETERRLLDLSVERETMAVRLEEAMRVRSELEARIAELTEVRVGADHQLSDLATQVEALRKENAELQDEVLRLPAELETVTKSSAFRIIKSAPVLAIRRPLSTLLIVGAMGALANLWTFSPVASTVYLSVGSLVLLVSAVQFLARNDGS